MNREGKSAFCIQELVQKCRLMDIALRVRKTD